MIMNSNEITKKETCGDNEERRRKVMKGLFNKIKMYAIAFAFMGAAGVGMTVLVNEPVLAVETVRKTGAETGYTIPNEITIKKGETKTITLNVPKGSTDVTNVAWGYTTHDTFTRIETQMGSYWGEKACITIKGTKAGTGYINAQTEVYKSKGNPASYKYTAYDKCVVKVVDDTVKQDTKQPVQNTSQNGYSRVVGNTVKKDTGKPLQSISLNKSSAVLAKGNTLNLNVSYSPYNTTDSKTVYWSSSNRTVASVSNGRVTANSSGTAVITARVGNKTASCKVTVNIPLNYISLNKTTMSLKAGESSMLYCTKNPSNTTESGSVSWYSNNTAVATVSAGRVVAKKEGTATITARFGNKTATCKVTVSTASVKNNTSKSTTSSKTTTTTSSKTTSTTASKTTSTTASTKEGYKNVSEAYTLTNQFRATRSNQWYWNADNRTKTYTYNLKPLARDVTLENVAKQRAKEQWTQRYVNNKITHTRPNGMSWTTAYPTSFSAIAENLGFGYTTCRDVILNGWAETDLKYENQGHRRNMLSYEFKRVGIACYEKSGKTCWAMCLGS